MGMRHGESDYEPLHFQSMREKLKPGDLTFDVGAYDGITSAIIARIVGPENVVIVEPGQTNWGTIREYWHARFAEKPRLTFPGFLSSIPGMELADVAINGWPPCAYIHPVSDAEEYSRFGSLHSIDGRPVLAIDTLALLATPKAITMDVEGAELLVLRGARQTLREHHPLVWVSIHPQFMPQFHTEVAELHSFMRENGYKESLVYTDHEEHWLFE